MATNFNLPPSGGAETSSVSFDPRRQVAPAGDDEITQVTQAGGKPALDVASTIQAQFAVGEPAPSGDAFGDGPPGATNADLDSQAAKYVGKRKAVHAEYAQKSAKQKKLADKATQDAINKTKLNKMLAAREANLEKSKATQAARRHNDNVSKAAQAKRRQMWGSIDQAEAKHAVLHKAKVTTAKTTDVRTTDTRTTNTKDTTVKDANVALTADPAKKPTV
jgi:hypothetical protein